jgi:hypothetical protein
MRSVYRKGESDMRILAIALAAVTLLSLAGLAEAMTLLGFAIPLSLRTTNRYKTSCSA